MIFVVLSIISIYRADFFKYDQDNPILIKIYKTFYRKTSLDHLYRWIPIISIELHWLSIEQSMIFAVSTMVSIYLADCFQYDQDNKKFIKPYKMFYRNKSHDHWYRWLQQFWSNFIFIMDRIFQDICRSLFRFDISSYLLQIWSR